MYSVKLQIVCHDIVEHGTRVYSVVIHTCSPLFAAKDNPGESRVGWNILEDERKEHRCNGFEWIMDRINGNMKNMKLLHCRGYVMCVGGLSDAHAYVDCRSVRSCGRYHITSG